MRDEIKHILDALEAKSPSAASFKKKLSEVLDDPPGLDRFANDLRKEIQATKDFQDDRIPFYNFYLAIAWLKNDPGQAKEALSNAVHGFRIHGFALNEALGEWLFGVIHLTHQKYERARRACETAISILQSLNKQYKGEGKYEKAKACSAHLGRLESFCDEVAASQSSATGLPPKDAPAQLESEAIKASLREYYDKLVSLRESLRQRKMRIPPTLVAAIFYLYKLLTPSHSVYSPPPTPATEHEENIYNGLMEKIGLFEVIEQLVELEKEFEPGASREELLDRVNLAWDKATAQ